VRLPPIPIIEGQLLCRFLDAGMPALSARCCSRRSKSAKARNRGTYAGAAPRALWDLAAVRDLSAGGRHAQLSRYGTSIARLGK
jgi:hypothetical protein